MILPFLILAYLSNDAFTQELTSPCPDTFYYEPQTDRNKWYGIMFVKTDLELTGMWIRIYLDSKAELLGNWLGETVSSDNKEFLISKTDYVLRVGPPVSIRFFVKYDPSKEVPHLKKIIFNGVTICAENVTTPRPTVSQLHISKPKPTINTEISSDLSSESNSNIEYNRPSSHHDSSNRLHGSSSQTDNSNGFGGSNNKPYGATNSKPYGATNERRNSKPYDNFGSSESDNSNGFSATNSRPYGSSTGTNDGANSRQNGSGKDRRISKPYVGANSRPVVNYGDTDSEINHSSGRYPSNLNDEYNQPVGGSNDEYVYTKPTTEPNQIYGSSSGRDEVYDNNKRYKDKEITQKPQRLSTDGLNNSGHDLFSVYNSEDGVASNNKGNKIQDSDNDFFQGDFNLPKTSLVSDRTRPGPSDLDQYKVPQCGTVALRPRPLISNGQDTVPGEWPWHAAIYHTKGIHLVYICGGSLISEKFVLTAAHCVSRARTNKMVDPESILVYLGKYNLKGFGPEVQDSDVSDIYIHPEFNYSMYYNDIAILKLSKIVNITDYVRPCCLWDENTDIENIVDKQGTVVGWGFDENKKISDKLVQAKMPVVTTIKCIYSNRDFFARFTFDKNFCAGFKNGTSVCNGDSGGAMVFPKRGTRGQSTVWQIRGIVSVGVALQSEGVCDTSQYVIFTDVAKHLTWINQVLRS